MKKLRANALGFTLVELVLVMALLIISVGVSSDIIISLIRSYSKTQITNELEQSANFISLKLEKELRGAVDITEPTLGLPSNTLRFENSTGDTIEYGLDTGGGRDDIFTRSMGAITADLNDNTVGGGGVSISCPGSCFELVGTNPFVVRINMRFSHTGSTGNNAFTGTVTLDNTIVARGSY